MKKFFYSLLTISIILFFFYFSATLSYLWTVRHDNSLFHNEVTYTNWMKYKKKSIGLNIMRGVFGSNKKTDDNLDEIRIIIPESDLQELDAALPKSGKKYKKAEMAYNGDDYKVKIRYRGDGSYHWFFDKKSYRIQIRKDKKISNHELIQLMNIKDAPMMAEFMGDFLADKMRLLTVDEQYVKLYINNEYQGVYLSLEPINKVFLETKQKPVGNIYSGDNGGEERIMGGLPLNVFQSASVWNHKLKNENGQNIYREDLNQLIKSIYYILAEDTGFVSLEKLLDMDYFSSFAAWITLGQVTHIDHFHNVVLYADPTSGRFIQIPWDSGSFRGSTQSLDIVTNELMLALHKNPDFVFKKYQIIWDLVENHKIYNQLIEKSNKTYDEIIEAVYADDFKASAPMRIPMNNREFDEAFGWYLDNLTHLSGISDQLRHVTLHFTQGVHENNHIQLNISVNGASSAELRSVSVNEGCTVQTGFGEGSILHPGRIRLDETSKVRPAPGQSLNIQPAALQYTFSVPVVGEDCKITGLEMKNAITGEEAIAKELPHFGEVVFSNFSIHPQDLAKEDLSVRNEFAQWIRSTYPGWNVSADNLYIPAGVHVVHTDVIVPRNMNFILEPGAELRITPGKSIVSYSRVLAYGEPSLPITVTSQTSEPFGVFGLANEGANDSIFRYVNFNNGSEKFIENIYFSGMLSAYHNDNVVVENCTFRNAQADDALNFKNSNSVVRDSLFENNSADAIDYDFMSGEITGSRFISNGNDSIDTSGATTLIKNNYIFNSGDKCMSFGENSHTIAFNNVMDSCHIGVEVKDSSQPYVINNVIRNNDVGVNSYQKKEHFGSAKGNFYNTLFYSNGKEVTFNNSFKGKKLKSDKSKIKIQHSNIPGGHKGEGNLDVEIIPGAIQIVGGNSDILKEKLGLEDDNAAIGLFNPFQF